MTSSVLIVPANYAGEIVFGVVSDDNNPDTPTLRLPDAPLAPDETPNTAAARVLQSHTGFRAEVTFPLGKLAAADSTVYLFLARNLVPAQHIGSAIYTAETKRVAFDAIEDLIAAGQLHDAIMIAAVFLARSFVSGSYRPNV